MASADAVLAYFDDLLRRGVREVPDGSNCCEVTKEFGPVGGAKCYAWCCATCSNALKRAGQPGFHTASVGGAISDAKAKKNGLLWLPATAECRRGDFCCWDSGISTGHPGNWGNFHINVVKNPGTQERMFCIGGNQSNAVTEGWYTRKNLNGFIRPAYSGISLPPTGDFMTPEQFKEMQSWFGFIHQKQDESNKRLAAIEKALAAGGGGVAPKYKGTIDLTPA